MKKIGIISLLILIVFAFPLYSCTSEVEKEIKTSDKEFLLGSFYTPYNGNAGSAPYGNKGSDNTVENWQIMKNAGFNFALPIYDITHTDVLTSLTNAQEVGMKVYVMDYENPGLFKIIQNNPNKSYDEVYAEILKVENKLIQRYDEFCTYSSFGGIHGFDEPSIEYYNAIAACQDWWYENYPDYQFFCNLFPSYASKSQLFGTSDEGYIYRDYVNMYCEKVNPQVISYDHYTLMQNGLSGYIRPQWLSDLEAYAIASREYSVPFQLYILTTKHWSYYAPEYYRDVAWQAYSAMCFGVRGIQTFTYWGYLKPYNDINNLGTGLVDAEGNIMPVYYAVQEVFNEISSFDEYYMAFNNWLGVMPIGTSGSGTFALMTEALDNVEGIKKVDATEDALVGAYKDDDGNIAYMVTNYSLPFANKTNTVTIKFENCSKVLICKKGRKIIETVSNNTLKLELGSGEGYFVIPLK